MEMDWLIKCTNEENNKKTRTNKFKRKAKGPIVRRRYRRRADVTLIRNNSRVSLPTDPVTRRRVQDIEPLTRAMFVEVPAVRCQVEASVTRHKCKGILLHEGVPFYILSLFGAHKQLFEEADGLTQERVWVYVQGRGVIQILWEDLQERVVDPVPDKVWAKVSCRGSVRLVPQRIGTRADAETKMALCFRLDFGAASETNRWLWVEESFILGLQQTVVAEEEQVKLGRDDNKRDDEIVVAEILATLATTLQEHNEQTNERTN